MKTKTWMAAAAAIAALSALQGCSTTASRISADGKSDKLVFPDAKRAWPQDGAFANRDHLRLLAPGMTKAQHYELLGRPHFNEGLAAVREWDYLFRFRTGPNASQVEACQLKVVYAWDKPRGTYLSRSYHWKPEACAGYVNDAPRVQVVQAATAQKPPRTVQLMKETLAADALFRFNGAGMADVSAQGQQQIAALAGRLGELKSVSSVEVIAHSDRLGSVQYNQALSQKRAEAVAGFLADKGVDPRLIVATGRGKSEPVSRCGKMPKAKLIECLAPDRRVEIRVMGTKEGERG